ncbi:hypothetical protein E4U54_007313 [Claviceps lovelessii]|nr:hypothetical protein E4U54_007313 [Claviceps lovelessii]
MKRGHAAAVLAVLANGVAASHQRNAHEALFRKSANDSTSSCTPDCTTIWSTFRGPPTLIPQIPKPHANLTTTTPCSVFVTQTVHPVLVTQTPETTPSPTPTPTHDAGPVPPPIAHHCPVPGDYTFPATTITVYQTMTYCPGSGGNATSTAWGTGKVTPTPTPTSGAKGKDSVVLPPGIYIAPMQVVHVHVKDYIFYCPFTRHPLPTGPPSPGLPPPPPPAVKPAPPPEVKPAPPPEVKPAPPPPEVKPPPPPEAQPTPPPPEVKPAPPPEVKPPPAKAQPTPPVQEPTQHKGLVSDNDHFGITYTLFRPADASCKTAQDVDSEIGTIASAGFTTVRIYSPECNALELVGNACKKHGIAMIVGVFVKASGCDITTPDIKVQVDALVAWNMWDIVSLVVVGNEAMQNGYCTPQQLNKLVGDVKSEIGAKYTGPYTISETLNVWLRPDVQVALCPAIDVTGANIHAYFNSQITCANAGVFVKGQIDILRTVCPGKQVINLECGYPSGGKANGLAIPGPEQQAAAIKSIRETSGHMTVFFDFQNNLWKTEGVCECEKKFGIASVFGMTVDYD